MVYDQIQKYAYLTLIVCVVSVLIGVSGMMPGNFIEDDKTYEKMEELSASWEGLSGKFQNASGIFDYIEFGILLLKEGILIILNIIALYFISSATLFKLFFIPAAIYTPIIILTNIIVIFDIGKLLLNRG